MAYPLQLASLFAVIQSDIGAVRTALGLPALNGPPVDTPNNGNIAIGHEYVAFNLNAPAIVIVPTGEEPLPAQRSGSPSSVAYGVTESPVGVATPTNPAPNQLISPTVASLQRKLYWSSWLNFDAYLWGDPDPLATGVQPFTGNYQYDFDSSLELRRQFLQALYRNGGGIPGVRWTAGRWEQPQDDKRWGRMYVLSFSIKQPIGADPYIFLPFSSTVGDGGVVISTTIVLQSPDGSSTDNIGPIVSPPA